MFVLFIVLVRVLAATQASGPATCEFRPVDSRWSGSCGAFLDGHPTLKIAPAKRMTSGTWRKDVQPTAVWAGEISDGGVDEPAEIEVYGNGTGLLRTESGWFPISEFQQAESLVRFRVDTAREAAPSDLDREIVKRAAVILSSESDWNRADDRRCPSTARTWSIYCAMERATIEVTGAFHHRRPALEVVREIIDQRTTGRNYQHRLMDYNNDPSTHLDDVRTLFTEALARMNR
jgi:hypothetical protein